jgi:hypothetical protein
MNDGSVVYGFSVTRKMYLGKGMMKMLLMHPQREHSCTLYSFKYCSRHPGFHLHVNVFRASLSGTLDERAVARQIRSARTVTLHQDGPTLPWPVRQSCEVGPVTPHADPPYDDHGPRKVLRLCLSRSASHHQNVKPCMLWAGP